MADKCDAHSSKLERNLYMVGKGHTAETAPLFKEFEGIPKADAFKIMGQMRECAGGFGDGGGFGSGGFKPDKVHSEGTSLTVSNIWNGSGSKPQDGKPKQESTLEIEYSYNDTKHTASQTIRISDGKRFHQEKVTPMKWEEPKER
jgi:hypothetical protein